MEGDGEQIAAPPNSQMKDKMKRGLNNEMNRGPPTRGCALECMVSFFFFVFLPVSCFACFFLLLLLFASLIFECSAKCKHHFKQVSNVKKWLFSCS